MTSEELYFSSYVNKMNAVEQGVDGLGSLQTKYQQLREACDKSENDSELSAQLVERSLNKFEDKLQQAFQYRQNLALQARAGLDADSEDSSGLKKQTDSADSYLVKLKTACGDILTHYEERQVVNLN